MATKIKDGVFIGDAETSQDPEFIELNKITYVINCAGRQLPNLWEMHGLRYLTFPWEDSDQCMLFDKDNVVADQIVLFVDEALAVGDSILIHSLRGTSRCVACCMAYLMRKYRWGFEKATQFVKAKRPDVVPNAGFRQQLQLLDKRLWLMVDMHPEFGDEDKLKFAERRMKWSPVPLSQYRKALWSLNPKKRGGGSEERRGDNLTDAVDLEEAVLVNSYLNSESDEAIMCAADPSQSYEDFVASRLRWSEAPLPQKGPGRAGPGGKGGVLSPPQGPRKVLERPPNASYNSMEKQLCGCGKVSDSRPPKSILKKQRSGGARRVPGPTSSGSPLRSHASARARSHSPSAKDAGQPKPDPTGASRDLRAEAKGGSGAVRRAGAGSDDEADVLVEDLSVSRSEAESEGKMRPSAIAPITVDPLRGRPADRGAAEAKSSLRGGSRSPHRGDKADGKASRSHSPVSPRRDRDRVAWAAPENRMHQMVREEASLTPAAMSNGGHSPGDETGHTAAADKGRTEAREAAGAKEQERERVDAWAEAKPQGPSGRGRRGPEDTLEASLPSNSSLLQGGLQQQRPGDWALGPGSKQKGPPGQGLGAAGGPPGGLASIKVPGAQQTWTEQYAPGSSLQQLAAGANGVPRGGSRKPPSPIVAGAQASSSGSRKRPTSAPAHRQEEGREGEDYHAQEQERPSTTQGDRRGANVPATAAGVTQADGKGPGWQYPAQPRAVAQASAQSQAAGPRAIPRQSSTSSLGSTSSNLELTADARAGGADPRINGQAPRGRGGGMAAFQNAGPVRALSGVVMPDPVNADAGAGGSQRWSNPSRSRPGAVAPSQEGGASRSLTTPYGFVHAPGAGPVPASAASGRAQASPSKRGEKSQTSSTPRSTSTAGSSVRHMPNFGYVSQPNGQAKPRSLQKDQVPAAPAIYRKGSPPPGRGRRHSDSSGASSTFGSGPSRAAAGPSGSRPAGGTPTPRRAQPPPPAERASGADRTQTPTRQQFDGTHRRPSDVSDSVQSGRGRAPSPAPRPTTALPGGRFRPPSPIRGASATLLLPMGDNMSGTGGGNRPRWK